MTGHVLAIDQGTTSSRAILFDGDMRIAAVAQKEFTQHYPASGWVEHDAGEIWDTVVTVCRDALEKAGGAPVAAIGITNQRETVVVWDRVTGEPVHRAIVWQDRRTVDLCASLREAGHEAAVTAATGLLIDPYFSATKLRWLLDTVEGLRGRAERGEVLFGTIDCWLIWKLTDGRVHATDATNACRTMLFDIHAQAWSEEICGILGVPMAMLPEVRDCADEFGETRAFGGPIAIRGVAGDQQAATLGQACFRPGMLKSTYGTGCFALLNTGETAVASSNRLLTTVAYRLDGKVTYALEGAIFIAGAVVQWLRDGLKIVGSAPETQALAEAADPTQDVIVVPAFVGLGAPWWEPEARGSVFGLARNSGPEELARAALESVGFQTRDLLTAMQADWPGGGAQVLRVDGGMSASDYAMQFLADVIGAPVDRPQVLETTALGAAWLAGHAAGVWPGMEEFARGWALERRFEPAMDAAVRDAKVARWTRAVRATIAV